MKQGEAVTVRIITRSQLIQHTGEYYKGKWAGNLHACKSMRHGTKCNCRCGAHGRWIASNKGIKGYTNIWYNSVKEQIECDEYYGTK